MLMTRPTMMRCSRLCLRRGICLSHRRITLHNFHFSTGDPLFRVLIDRFPSRVFPSSDVRALRKTELCQIRVPEMMRHDHVCRRGECLLNVAAFPNDSAAERPVILRITESAEEGRIHIRWADERYPGTWPRTPLRLLMRWQMQSVTRWGTPSSTAMRSRMPARHADGGLWGRGAGGGRGREEGGGGVRGAGGRLGSRRAASLHVP